MLLGAVVTLMFIAGIVLLLAAIGQHQRVGKEWDRHR
jgi:hypothetical protein